MSPMKKQTQKQKSICCVIVLIQKCHRHVFEIASKPAYCHGQTSPEMPLLSGTYSSKSYYGKKRIDKTVTYGTLSQRGTQLPVLEESLPKDCTHPSLRHSSFPSMIHYNGECDTCRSFKYKWHHPERSSQFPFGISTTVAYKLQRPARVNGHLASPPQSPLENWDLFCYRHHPALLIAMVLSVMFWKFE